MPPMYGEQVQLGNTLKWQIDLFYPDTEKDLTPQLARIADIAKGLELAVNLYGYLIGSSEDTGQVAADDRSRK